MVREASPAVLARVLAAVAALESRREAVTNTAVAREAGIPDGTVSRPMASLRRDGRLPPPPRGRRDDWEAARAAVLAEAGRLVLARRAPTAPAVAASLGMGLVRVEKIMKRLRAAGLLPRARGYSAGKMTPAETRQLAPSPSPSVWPEGRPEDWEPAVACRFYIKEFRARRRRVS